jgi:hypothetical protein
MKDWKKAFSLTLLLTSVFSAALFGQQDHNKTIKKDFERKPEVNIAHRYGPLVIKKSTDGKIHLQAALNIKGKQESAEAVFEEFDLHTEENSNRLEVNTRFEVSTWNSVNGKTTIKFKNGARVTGLHDVKINLTVFLPDVQTINMENKYDKIVLEDDFAGALNVVLYSGELSARNIGDLTLDLKYGKANFQKGGKMKWTIYDSEIRAGDLAGGEVSSKYSEVELANVAGSLSLETYDDKWKVGDVGANLEIDDKYSEFRFGNLEAVKLHLYDANFEAMKIKDISIEDTKYSEYKIKRAKSFQLRESFDDEFDIEILEGLNAFRSKYSEYKIGTLISTFSLTDSFDDAAKLYQVAADFNNIFLDGKYTELDVNIDESAEFKVSVEMEYGKFDYPEKKVDVRIYKEKDSQLLVEGFVGPEQRTPPFDVLSVRGFDNTLIWR